MLFLFLFLLLSKVYAFPDSTVFFDGNPIGVCNETLLFAKRPSDLTLGGWLKRLAKERQFSQQDIENLTGLNRANLSRIMNDVQIGSYETHALLAYAFERPVEEPFLVLARSQQQIDTDLSFAPLNYAALNMPSFGAWIKYHRQKMGMLMEEFAIKIGFENHASVSRLESNQMLPNVDKMPAVAKGVGASLEEAYLVIAKRFLFASLERDNSDFLPRVIDVFLNKYVQKTDLPPVQAAAIFESFIKGLKDNGLAPTMIRKKENADLYAEVVSQIDSKLFEKALKDPDAIKIREQFLAGEYNQAALAQEDAGKAFESFIKNLKAQNLPPRVVKQNSDGRNEYSSFYSYVGSARFGAVLKDPDAIRIRNLYLQKRAINKKIYNSEEQNSIDEADSQGMGNLNIDAKGDVNAAERSGAAFNQYIVNAKRSGKPVRMVPQTDSLYFEVYNYVSRDEFMAQLTDPNALEIASLFALKQRIVRQLNAGESQK